MTLILIIIGIVLLCAILVLFACMLSSQISQFDKAVIEAVRQQDKFQDSYKEET